MNSRYMNFLYGSMAGSTSIWFITHGCDLASVVSIVIGTLLGKVAFDCLKAVLFGQTFYFLEEPYMEKKN